MTTKTMLTDAELTAAFHSANGERKHFTATFGKYDDRTGSNKTLTLTASDAPTANRIAREYGARFLGGLKLVYVYLVSTDPKPAVSAIEGATSVTVVTVSNRGGSMSEHVHANGCADIARTVSREIAAGRQYFVTEYANTREALEANYSDLASDGGSAGSPEWEEALQMCVGGEYLSVKPCVPSHLKSTKAVK